MTRNSVALCTSPGVMTLETREIGEPASGSVLLRVRNCGICGSDLHFYRGEFPIPPDMPMGHEIAGEVAAIGEGVAAFSVGDRVAVEPVLVCRECAYCTSGERQLCPQRVLLGTGVAGGLQEYLEVPPYSLHKLPDSVPFHIGALVEPVAVCVHGFRIVDLKPREHVAILGAGTIGLIAVAVAREMGAASIAITARHSHQAEAARALGADAVFPASEEGDRALAATPGRLARMSCSRLSAARPTRCLRRCHSPAPAVGYQCSGCSPSRSASTPSN
ncbi:MAG: alcohol dehydrogenase catalytic domain-containing protein [Dehalococcoidia bacterium]